MGTTVQVQVFEVTPYTAAPSDFSPLSGPTPLLGVLAYTPHGLTLNMPHIHTSVVSSSHFHLIVIRSLKTYKERTKKDLFAHPIAAQLRACNSPGAILFVLQQQVQARNQSQYSHERLTDRLDRTVNILYAFSRALGLVCFRTHGF